MDLCLRGSQINLAQREKVKPKHLYQKNIPYATNYRPRSASYTSFKRSNTSPTPFLHRPQSADPKFCTGAFNSLFQGNSAEARKLALNSKRYKSISSSSLLKLLLEERIPRSGCYRDDSTTNGSSPDLRFESNVLKRSTGKTEQHRKSTSLEVSSIDDDNSEQIMNPIGFKRNLNCSANKRKMSRESTGSKGVTEAFKQNASKENNYQSNLSTVDKTDLPGRVSFFKTNVSQDVDYSDSENDKNEYFPRYSTSPNAEEDNSSSTPGPLKFPTYESSKDVISKSQTSQAQQEPINTCSKKSVHFGNSSNESILAETFVYSNMTSENCSASTRSSSTASLQDTTDIKCSCCAHTVINSQIDESKPTKSNFEIKTKTNVEKPEENMKTETKLDSISKSYSDNSVVNREKSNIYTNFPENYTLTKTENNLNKSTLDDLLADNDDQLCNSSESVIKNYLEVAASASILCKQEVYQAKATNTVSTTVSKKFTYTKGKKTTLDPKNKKASSVGVKEDKGLTQFRLDEIESWMTVHESKKPERSDENICKEQNNANIELEGDGALKEDNDLDSQMSYKSDHSQEDFMYDDIVSVIKEIEEDKKKDNLAEKVVNEMELKLNTPTNEEQITTKEERPETPDKYKSILSYLDEIEESCDKALLDTRRSLPESSRSEIEFVVEPDITEDVPKLSDLLMIPNHQLARRVIALSLRANELGNAVLLSKEHVNRIRAEKHKLIRSEKVSSATRLRDQKKHYETIVQRHQGFIEQLLKDKGSLCEKIAALTRRLESQNGAWEHRLETEVARIKETTLAGEKIKRERWVRENTKRIKELTVKGLEAEINKMNSSHQQEIAELKRAHQEQMLAALEETRRKHEQIENSIRESAAKDREFILEKERTAIRQRFDRQMEQERKSLDEQKEKLCMEFAAERERLELELKNKESEFQLKKQDILREKQLEMEQAVAELQEKMSKQEEKYQNRINTIEKQYEGDFQLWKKEYENQCKLLHAEKENVIRQNYRSERDRQIDEIVKRMDAEALKSAEEHEAKIRRLKEKYEQDVLTLENTEKGLREKYAETRNNLAESDAQVRNLSAEIKQLHIELEHTKKRCKESLDERDQLRDNLRNEVQNEVTAIKNERDTEIEKIHKRVQQAIEKKNTTIDILQKESNTLRERCLKLEAVIRQQRKDYCAK